MIALRKLYTHINIELQQIRVFSLINLGLWSISTSTLIAGRTVPCIHDPVGTQFKSIQFKDITLEHYNDSTFSTSTMCCDITVLYCTVLYCTVLYCTVLYCSKQYERRCATSLRNSDVRCSSLESDKKAWIPQDNQ